MLLSDIMWTDRKRTEKDRSIRNETDHPREVRVCSGKACTRNNSRYLMKRLEGMFGVKRGEPTKDVDLDFCQCTGHCHYGPNIKANGEILMKSQVFKLKERIEKSFKDPMKDENETLEKIWEDEAKHRKEHNKDARERDFSQIVDDALNDDILGEFYKD